MAAVAALVWFGVVAGRRRSWDAALDRDHAEARWVADQLVPSVAGRSLSPEQVQAAWTDGKRRLDDLQSDLYRLGTSIPNGGDRAARLGTLSGTLAALQQSLEADVALRLSDDGTPESAARLSASAATVEQNRQALQSVVLGP